MDRSQRAFYALLLAFLLVLLGWGASEAGGEGLAFGLFAGLTLGGSLVCIWERNVVRSAFALMGTFGGVAGLFLLLGSDFIAMAQVLIYVGAILALLLFGVMLSPPDLRERKISRVVAGLVLLGGAVAWVGAKVAATVEWATVPELAEPQTRAKEIGLGFLRADGYVVAFELAAVVLTVALVAAVYIARRRTADFQPPEAEEA